VPAAGFGSRARLPSGSKEVCRVWGRPLLAHLVARMREAEVDEIRVVTRPGKEDVVACARELGARVVLGTPGNVGESVGLGAADLGPGDLALIGFPDTVWEDDGVFPLLLEALGEADVSLALFRHADPAAADVVGLDGEGRVVDIDVKPSRPRGDLIWGCAVARAPLLRALDAEPGRTFADLARRSRVAAVRFDGAFVDLGVHDRLGRAQAGEPLRSVAVG
jgi:dTDP-glucose pyrophosphorylase